MLALGVVGDSRPQASQPPLREGIHLRWAFDHVPLPDLENPEPVTGTRLGFPWYGFYLLRRLTPAGGVGTTCASSQLGGFSPGFRNSPELGIPLGRFHSDKNLRLTDDFPAPGTVELDLSGRNFVEFNIGHSCSHIQVTIGFVQDWPPPGGTGTGTGSGTGTGTGTTFPPDGTGGTGSGGGNDGLGSRAGSAVGGGCGCGCDHAAIVPIAERVIPIAPGQYRATFGYRNGGSTTVSMPVGAENRFLPDPQDRGQPTTFLPGRRANMFAVVFDGRPLTWRLGGHTVTVSAADSSTPGDDGSGGTGGSGSGSGSSGSGSGTGTPGGTGTSTDGIIVTGLKGQIEVATVVVSGRAGQVVTAAIPFDAIDGVRVSAGPARLIDVCATPVLAGIGDGWEPVANFPQPMCLPVFKDEYPCNPGPVDEAASRSLALARISYGSTAPWSNSGFTELHEALLDIVNGGPMKGITDFVEDVTALPDPNDPSADPPESVQQSSLDLLLGASIHPAMAQMLGLYWVDDTAVEGVSYDYMLVADYQNAAGGSLATVQALVAAGDFTNIEAYPKRGAYRVVSPPLAAPSFVHGFALPTAAPPPTSPGDAVGVAGLVWEIPLETNGKISSESPVLYEVWQAAAGQTVPRDAIPEARHNRIGDAPVTPSNLLSEPPEEPLVGWPTFGLFATDGPLVDGWYSYRVSGIDIFGRFSALSAPARWLDIDGVTSKGNDVAVRITDRTPPSAPTQVQAFALDPDDPFVTKDAAYNAWRAAFPNAMGLRVRWLWTGRHMRLAPDLREFRLYFQPGSQLADAGLAEKWSARIAVVDPDDNIVPGGDILVPLRSGASATASADLITIGGSESLEAMPFYGAEIELPGATGKKSFVIRDVDVERRTVQVEGTPSLAGSSSWTIGMRERTYEIFFPNAGQNYTLPLAPTLATPLLYGLVGVSGADDKVEAPDPRTGGGRYGNEGAVGGPVTVYRVWRDAPGPAPLPPFPGERLLATRADFYSRSFFMLHWSRTPNLFTHVFRAVDQTIFQLDAGKGFSGSPRAAELGNQAVYPPEWSAARRQAAANQINALTSFVGYASLGDDALRLLASLPSNSEAFTRLSRTPLGMPDPETHVLRDPDQVGPNDDPSYVPAADRGSFLDTLDGRATNLYFYRTAAVDGAQNLGPLGVSTPPVALPETRVPPTINFSRALGREQAIELAWPNRPDLGIASYRLFRTDDPNAAGDVRLMTEVGEAIPAGAGTEIVVVDREVVPLTETFYRLVSVGATDVESKPSLPVHARALRTQAAFAPRLLTAERLTSPSVSVQLTWAAEPGLSVMVQRRVAGVGAWRSISGWLAAGTLTYVDAGVDAVARYEYRLRGRDASGIQTDLSNVLTTEAV